MNKKLIIRWGLVLFLCYGTTLVHIMRIRGRQEQQSIMYGGDETVSKLLPPNLISIENFKSRHRGKAVQDSASRIRKASRNIDSRNDSLNLTSRRQEAPGEIKRVYTCQNTKGKTVQVPRTPDFIIGGTQKGGTTALLYLIQKHPGILSSTTFEAHFFDYDSRLQRLNQTELDLLSQSPERLCDLREAYAKDHFPFDKLIENPDLMSFAKTPGYILYEEIAARIKTVTPWVKILFSLRNPIDRAFSHFQMMKTRQQLPKTETFESFLALDLKVLEKKNFKFPTDHPFPKVTSVNPRRLRYMWKQKNIVYRGLYADQLRPWLEHFTLGEDLMVVQFERMLYEPDSVMDEILDFLGMHRLNYHPSHFNKSYDPLNHGARPDIHDVEHHEKEGVRMNDETRDYLMKLYEPYNEELACLLGDHWRGIWNSTSY